MSRTSRPALQLDAQGRPISLSALYTEFRGTYDANDNLIYAGYARPGTAETVAFWQIFRCAYDVNDNLVDVKWPLNTSGVASNDFEFAWSGRAGYTYA